MSKNGPPVPFSALPLSKAHASTKLNAWGAYGEEDERGFLNRQTDEIVAAAAASEIKTGTRVSLNAALDFQGRLNPSIATPLHQFSTLNPTLFRKQQTPKPP